MLQIAFCKRVIVSGFCGSVLGFVIFGAGKEAGISARLITGLLVLYILAPISFYALVWAAQERDALVGHCLIDSYAVATSCNHISKLSAMSSSSAYFYVVHKMRRVFRPSKQWNIHELKVPVLGILPILRTQEGSTAVKAEFSRVNRFLLKVTDENQTCHLTLAHSPFLIWRLISIERTITHSGTQDFLNEKCRTLDGCDDISKSRLIMQSN